MEAKQVYLYEILGGRQQFIVPRFQRYYSWELKNWKQMWEDLTVLLQSNGPAQHFIGSFVSKPTEVAPYSQFPSFELIDGQQRLVTLTLLLCAIRDLATNLGETNLAEQIYDDYLRHRHGIGSKEFKIIPRTPDRDTLTALIQKRRVIPDGRIKQSYDFFHSRLEKFTEKKTPATVSPLLRSLFEAITMKLSLVMITLSHTDNPYKIFSSLNATGAELTEADLIRNQVFTLVQLDKQQEFDDTIWAPFENKLPKLRDGAPDGEAITKFYRDYLMCSLARTETNTKEIFVRPRETYMKFVDYSSRYGSDNIKLVRDMSHHADYYMAITKGQEINPDLLAIFERLHALNVTTAYPLILHWYELYDSSKLAFQEFQAMLLALESFVVRRSIVRARTKGYGEQFLTLIKDVATLQNLKDQLRKLDFYGWPSDEQIRAALAKFEFYRHIKSKARLAIYRRIELSYKHKEVVNFHRISVDHVMPQKLTDEWRKMLGPDASRIHSTYVHNIGNLTLTGCANGIV